MIPRRYRIFAWIVPVVLVNWLLLAAIPLSQPGGAVVTLLRQALTGTLFGQTTIAAAWTVFGPTRLVWRLPLSLIWVTMLAAAIAINAWWSQSGPPGEYVIVGIVLLSQWLLLQFPLWAMALGFGIHLSYADDADKGLAHRQFGILQVMIVTALVGVLFDIGRLAIPYFLRQMQFLGGEVWIMAFIVVAEVVLTLPLLLGALLRHRTVLGVALALGLVAVATACELQLLRMVVAGGTLYEIVAMNLGTIASMLPLLAIVRLNGYALANTHKPSAR